MNDEEQKWKYVMLFFNYFKINFIINYIFNAANGNEFKNKK